MSGRWRRGRAAFALLTCAALLLAAWTLAALHFQLAGPARWGASALTLAALACVLVLGWRRARDGWLALAGVALLLGLWWGAIRPRDDRDWAPDVAHGVTAVFHGDNVTVANIRDFEWESRDRAVERWRVESYPLDAITSVDLATSVWSSPAIAHVLVSFGFADGRHLVFSAEIRRERDEAFSSFGGFFRAFELVLIAAEERDILRLRTDFRGEDVSLYPLHLTQAQARALFTAYLERGNALAARPEFYNTVTANCTTVIFRLARVLAPGLPLDWRLLASGYLPEYLHDLGVIDGPLPIEEIRARGHVTEKARALPPGADYSAGIRADWPALWEAD